MHIPTNTTPDEFFAYHCTDDNAREFYEKNEGEMASLLLKIEQLEKRLELVDEQRGFALELIDNIQAELHDQTRLTDVRKGVKTLIANSYLEI